MLTKLGKVCGQIKIHTDLYDMTLYNTRFGMQSKTYFPYVSCVCVSIIGKTKVRTFVRRVST